MRKISLKSIYPLENCIFSNNFSHVFKVDNDIVFKMFDYGHLISLLDYDYDIEENVLKGSSLVNDSSIIIPSSCVYKGRAFIGYTMPFVKGVSVMNYINDDMSLSFLTNLYCQIESIVMRNENIVFPDLLSDGNIMVDSDSNVYFIDFDGLQIFDYLTPDISSGLGCRNIYNFTKYKSDNSYTKQLDVKSLVYLYFSMVFSFPLENIDNYISNDRVDFILPDLFGYLGIDDCELFDKVLRLYKECPNMYLGDTVKRIAEKYNLCIIDNGSECVKRLVRK